MKAAGILGLGTYLPSTVRTNDWWPDAVVADWGKRMAHRATRSDGPPPESMGSGARRTLAAMGEFASDPFRGARERRVMGSDMSAAQMEANAAREAIARSGIRLDEIDVILSQTPVPDHLMVNNGCVTHKLLELPKRCLAVGTEAACNGFALHMSIAKGMIASGQARNVLSVHSSAITRVHGPEEPHSAWWGDGAAAAVIGPVADGNGLLASVHNADGNQCDALVLGTGPDKNWWDNGSITTHSINREATRNMLFGMIDRGVNAVETALSEAKLAKQDVDFLATHQSTAWLTREFAKEAALTHAKTMITFPYLCNMNSVNVPFILAMGEKEGMIKPGSVVTTFSGGLGETWSSLVLRWGR
jgi:3-oxoacyl-[acyl-carrier-protein] synthase III